MENVANYVQLLTSFHVPKLGFTFLDIIIIIVTLFYAYEGYAVGFTQAVADLLCFILSFILALKLYSYGAQMLILLFSMALGFANAVSFFILAFISEIILNIVSRTLLQLVPIIDMRNPLYKAYKAIDRPLGLVPGAMSAFIVLSFILTVIVALPSSPFIKQLVTGSKLGSKLVANTSFFEDELNTVFGGALNDTLNFLTVEPESNETVELHFKVTNGTIDQTAEQDMFQMVNQQRVKYGLMPLTFDNKLRAVGRAHSLDMFERGYFSHYTPEGLSPFDRMTNAGISFSYAGENLALAPSTDLAMQGLMNSPGHRANILSPHFHKIGIGAIDGGIYGIMFSQEFTN